MKPTRGTQTRWLLALGGVALVVATSGCSALIAHSGVSSASEIYKPETRAEVRAAFGEADETGTCPDGRPMERRSIPHKIPWFCRGTQCVPLRNLVELSLSVAVDTILFPLAAYQSERAKLHYAFVYGADDRVLYRYDVTAAPLTRFWQTFPSLTSFWFGDSPTGQVEKGGRATWEACVSAFAAEVRQRAACVDYPLTPQDEETLRLMQALAAEVDAGHLAPDDTLAEFEWCLRSTPFSCLRP